MAANDMMLASYYALIKAVLSLMLAGPMMGVRAGVWSTSRRNAARPAPLGGVVFPHPRRGFRHITKAPRAGAGSGSRSASTSIAISARARRYPHPDIPMAPIPRRRPPGDSHAPVPRDTCEKIPLFHLPRPRQRRFDLNWHIWRRNIDNSLTLIF